MGGSSGEFMSAVHAFSCCYERTISRSRATLPAAAFLSGFTGILMQHRVVSLPVSGTIYSTDGLQRFAPRSWRVALLALGIPVVVLLLVGIIELIIWSRLGHARDELRRQASTPSFSAAQMQHGVERMNGALLRHKLSNRLEDEQIFHSEARALQGALKRDDASADLRELFAKYLVEATTLMEQPLGAVRKDSAARLAEQIEQLSTPLLQSARRSAAEQNAALNAAFATSVRSIQTGRRLIEISGALLLLMLAGAALLTYLPFRHRVRESHALLERQEKLASLGTLATGVAHEIRNPLAAIKFRLFSLKKALPAPFAGHEDLVVIRQEIDRLDELVNDFLQFARPATPKFAPVQAGDLLHDVQSLLAPELERNAIRLELEAAQDLSFSADKEQLTQVLINLVQNAADSIARDGAVTLRARHGLSKVNRQSTPVVILEVSDTGKGISAEAEARIFDPFFSTKDSGTGLGLSIAARIVENHSGLIQCQSQLNRGTTFTIVLPRAQNHVPAHPAH
jgi:signal transduction histidine kinase